ncbi:von Willebrand factor type A domain-containing protein [Flagellimonas taeanensis]|uniref:von Willebrand factor type A domain-containing protein n=1 Tax=Flagellimonas taeanensis TaxID=1005926 RepID=A0A1M6TJ99_9FLAO|nr:vWA domain-containing protein [Allomuricauda taeanensis]SFB88764.1 von Willebrand factor type A domain-containing protein [Allomuricauda taeanensis]SHK57162.1 von Willebrand factor type A domain-containing protein [Allomuricauda taeanensis]
MKHLNKVLGTAFALMATGASYGCNLKAQEKENTVLVTQSIVEKPSKHFVKIALLLDTSNSMDGLINQAKAQLWDIVNEFTHAKCGNDTRPMLQIALYEYGNDNLSSREGYIRQVLGFSDDLDEISEKLFSLTTNGGEEYCGEVIQTSLKQLDWGKNADDLKMIFIAGNEPFTQGKLNYRDAAANAKEKDVIVNTIFCGNFQQGINTEWKSGASLTGGEYMAIDHNQQVVHINTPYDDVIIKLNSKLNNTYISYGSLGYEKKALQSAQDSNAAELEEVVVVKRAVSKSSRLYKNTQWDLVDAVEDDEDVLTRLKEEDLPKELKGKSKSEIKAYVDDKKAEREKIQKEIQELNAKREAYIAQNQKEEKGELENAMLSAIKNQASKKNMKWD